VSVERLASAVENVAHRVARDHKVEIVNRVASVLHVRRESVLQGESDRSHKVARNLRARRAHRAHRESVLHAHRERESREPGEPKALSREAQSFQRRRKLLRLRYLRFRKFRRPEFRRLRHHRHLYPAMARLRASRGDSKPCYWHRHDTSTASNIAVA